MAAMIQESRPNRTSSLPGSPRTVLLAGGVIVVAALAAYRNSFHGPLVFDDIGTIAENLSIRRLWTALRPPVEGMPVTGRPIANLSFAFNYAVGGTSVWGYHAVNLLIHILAGLTLFGIIRRTLERWSGLSPTRSSAPSNQRVGDNPLHLNTAIALAIALIWTLHPLQTESVTYISQRAESLMGLFYFLTLYCFIRSVDGKRFEIRNSKFEIFSVAACLFGMATKEVMVSAPVIVLLYDRTFVAGTFGEAWRRRGRYYIGLACTWLLLAALLAGTGSRGGTAGFGAEISWATYTVTQFRAVAHYLRLSIWPYPLVFFYGSTVGAPAAEMAVDVAVVTGLLAATGWCLIAKFRNSKFEIRNFRALGFAGAWFFLILAPSSSVVPVATETIAEHRMYLSLAAVVAVGVCGGYSLLRRILRAPPLTGMGGGAVLLAVAVLCIRLTAERNEDYRSGLVLWRTTADEFPSNEVAQYNLAMMLAGEGKMTDAIGHYRAALRLKPDYTEAHNNLGLALAGTGQWTEAIAQYEEALERDPEYAMIHDNLGDALLHLGKRDEAIASYEQGVQVEPDSPEAYYKLGAALIRAGRAPEAIAAYENALRLGAGSPRELNELGYLLAKAGRMPEAITQFQRVVKLQPGDVEAHDNLGSALAQTGRVAEAAEEFKAASLLDPDNPELHNNLGCALAQLGRTSEARSQFEEALRLAPNDAAVRANLARLPKF